MLSREYRSKSRDNHEMYFFKKCYNNSNWGKSAVSQNIEKCKNILYFSEITKL